MPRDPWLDRKYLEHDEAYVQSALETIAYDRQQRIDAELRERRARQLRLPGDHEIDGEVEFPHLAPHMKGWLDDADA